MSTPFQLRLPRQFYTAMLEQAQAELPNECCGLLAGTVVRGIAQVEARYPLVNDLDSPREYNAEPRSLLAAYKDMRTRGIEVVAIYHSHPTSPPIPSKKDLERSFDPDVVNFIIGLERNPPEMHGWWLGDLDFVEAVWEVVDDME